MFFIVLGVLLAAPAAINLANRVIVEELIPGKKLKKAKKEGIDLADIPTPVPLDMALTPRELDKLTELGAMDILRGGLILHGKLIDTAEAEVPLCTCCGRLVLQ